MFKYPITLPSDTLYEELGIGPEASPQEIGDARAESIRKIDRGIRTAQDRLDAVYERVPDLRSTSLEVERLLETSERGSEKKLVQLRERLKILERKADAVDPEHSHLSAQIASLEQRKAELNRVDLQNADQRQEYDRTHPPADLLKLERDRRNPFCRSDDVDLDRSLALALLRRELADFLADRGEAVFHPSDLSRRDFSGDFSYHRILDGDDQ